MFFPSSAEFSHYEKIDSGLQKLSMHFDPRTRSGDKTGRETMVYSKRNRLKCQMTLFTKQYFHERIVNH